MRANPTNNNQKNGKLYLIPTSLGASNFDYILPIRIKSIVEGLTEFIAENEKTARHFIKGLAPEIKQSTLHFNTLNKRTTPRERSTFLNPCLSGQDMGLLSEAGCPGVADPGAHIVEIAHKQNIKVIPLVGPSSIILAMMASGLNGQNFAFNGYLPIDKADRKQAIRDLERRSHDFNQAQSFIETPYRNNALLKDLIKHLHPTTKICVACDLTLPSEMILTKTVRDWKKYQPDLHKRPAIFIIQKEAF